MVTLQDIQKKYGRDVEELYEELDRETKLAENYDVEYATQPFGSKQPAEPNVNINLTEED